MTEAAVIAGIMDNTRRLTKWYLKKFERDEISLRLEAAGTSLNSVYWITAHLLWTEFFLVLKSIGGSEEDIPWLGQFSIGSEGSPREDWPGYDEILHHFDAVHEKTLQCIRSLDDEQLEAPFQGMMFKTRREALYHLIRHEGTHIGHLSWLCKLMGKADQIP